MTTELPKIEILTVVPSHREAAIKLAATLRRRSTPALAKRKEFTYEVSDKIEMLTPA